MPGPPLPLFNEREEAIRDEMILRAKSIASLKAIVIALTFFLTC